MKIMAILIIFVLIVFFENHNIIAQTPDVNNNLIIRNNTGQSNTLSFGLDPLATDGVDSNLGESDLPPFPPIEAWDVRFFLPLNNWIGLSSHKDYRLETNFPYTGQREHRINIQIGQFTDTLFIEWNFPPEVTGVLQDLITEGSIINETMQGSDNYMMIRGVNPDPLLIYQFKIIIDYNNVVADVAEDFIMADNFTMEQNFPNPFNPSTTIKVSIPVSSDISLKVFNMLGELHSIIASGYYSAGVHHFNFVGNNLPSGVYIYQLQYDEGLLTKKMTLIK